MEKSRISNVIILIVLLVIVSSFSYLGLLWGGMPKCIKRAK